MFETVFQLHDYEQLHVYHIILNLLKVKSNMKLEMHP